jgi:hypothetical protein
VKTRLKTKGHVKSVFICQPPSRSGRATRESKGQGLNDSNIWSECIVIPFYTGGRICSKLGPNCFKIVNRGLNEDYKRFLFDVFDPKFDVLAMPSFGLNIFAKHVGLIDPLVLIMWENRCENFGRGRKWNRKIVGITEIFDSRVKVFLFGQLPRVSSVATSSIRLLEMTPARNLNWGSF